MNRRVIVIVVGVVVAGLLGWTLLRPSPAPPKPTTVAAPTAVPAPPPPPSPPAAAAPAEAARVRAPKAASRPPARSEASPEPAPAPAEAAADLGVLHIDTDVPGAQVFLDREFIGNAPVTAPNVKPGTHRLNVSAAGYDGVADAIDVSAGPRDILVKLKEVRLDLKIDVVHKHRFGACQGRLVATPQALRYETTDKDDAFSIALLDLDTFQVDYLAKNLRIKSRTGNKRFDFTDPDGNADRLFVFQRDVAKAIDRLKRGDPPAGQ